MILGYPGDGFGFHVRLKTHVWLVDDFDLERVCVREGCDDRCGNDEGHVLLRIGVFESRLT